MALQFYKNTIMIEFQNCVPKRTLSVCKDMCKYITTYKLHNLVLLRYLRYYSYKYVNLYPKVCLYIYLYPRVAE